MNIAIDLPQDSDGFIEYECPFCEKRFRLPINAFQNDNISCLYCPYCSLSSEPNRFGTAELNKLIEETAYRAAQDEIEKSLKDIAKKSNGLIKYKPAKKTETHNVILDETISDRIVCKNCNIEYKVDDGEFIQHTCPICGEKTI